VRTLVIAFHGNNIIYPSHQAAPVEDGGGGYRLFIRLLDRKTETFADGLLYSSVFITKKLYIRSSPYY